MTNKWQNITREYNKTVAWSQGDYRTKIK